MTIEVGVGSGGLPKLAPNLTWPSSLASNNGSVFIGAINAVGSLTTVLSLTGKYAIDLLRFDGLASESMTFKLTIDGVVIWNDTFSPSAGLRLFGSNTATNSSTPSTMQCDASLLLEVQTTADASIGLYYVARPIS